MSKLSKKIFFLSALLLVLTATYTQRFKILVLLSMVEERLQTHADFAASSQACSPQIAFHRGYGRAGQYLENSLESLTQAKLELVKNIEIDVSLDTEVYLGHSLQEKTLSLTQFISQFEQAFDLVIIDVKEIKNKSDISVNQLLAVTKYFKQVIFVGRDCELLHQLSIHNHQVSCEAYGPLAHRILGWSIVSRDFRRVTIGDVEKMKNYGQKLLTWTLENPKQVQTICHLHPSLVLVKEPQ